MEFYKTTLASVIKNKNSTHTHTVVEKWRWSHKFYFIEIHLLIRKMVFFFSLCKCERTKARNSSTDRLQTQYWNHFGGIPIVWNRAEYNVRLMCGCLWVGIGSDCALLQFDVLLPHMFTNIHAAQASCCFCRRRRRHSIKYMLCTLRCVVK